MTATRPAPTDARVEALEPFRAILDTHEHADTCGSVLSPGEDYPCSCWQADLRAALSSSVIDDLIAKALTDRLKGVTGASLVATERQRQIDVEGYDAAHDAAHGADVLVRAARCYEGARVPWMTSRSPAEWPWLDDDWKPRDRSSNLIRAGALYRAAGADPAARKVEKDLDVLLDAVRSVLVLTSRAAALSPTPADGTTSERSEA